jgi:hypothetical protein
MQKLLSTLLMTCIMAFGGTTVAGSVTTQQAPDNPVDCKKAPQDPRCKDR